MCFACMEWDSVSWNCTAVMFAAPQRVCPWTLRPLLAAGQAVSGRLTERLAEWRAKRVSAAAQGAEIRGSEWSCGPDMSKKSSWPLSPRHMCVLSACINVAAPYIYPINLISLWGSPYNVNWTNCYMVQEYGKCTNAFSQTYGHFMCSV